MAISILFGGILLGFTGMVLLSLMHYRRHREELRKAPVYQRKSLHRED